MRGARVKRVDVDLKAVESGQADMDAGRIEVSTAILLKAADAKRADLKLDTESPREPADHARVNQARGHFTVTEAENAGEADEEERRNQDDRQDKRPERREPGRHEKHADSNVRVAAPFLTLPNRVRRRATQNSLKPQKRCTTEDTDS